MLKPYNVRMELSNVRKKKVRKPPNVRKKTVISDVRTTQCEDEIVKCEKKRVREPLNMKKKTVTCDVGTAQCEDGTITYEKKVWEPPNVRKELLHLILELHNMKIEPSNMRKK